VPLDSHDGRLSQWLTKMLNYGSPDGPDQAWPIVLALVNRAPDEQTLTFVGASALEDLVNNAGAQFAHRIRDRAAADSRFRQALCDVWCHADAPASLRTLVDAVRSEFWSPQPDDTAAH
jgi:putative NIF3 family GTP cyclohydrolase 1 type 2